MDASARLLAMLKANTPSTNNNKTNTSSEKSSTPSPPPPGHPPVTAPVSTAALIENVGNISSLPSSINTPPSHPSSSYSSHPHPLSQSHAPISQAPSSPREPSPTPPPPSLQQVSLDDLFKSISSPPNPQPHLIQPPSSQSQPSSSQSLPNPANMPLPISTATSPPIASPSGSVEHKAKLLGMLSGLGGSSQVQTQQRQPSVAGALTPDARPSSGASSPADKQVSNLLTTLRSPIGPAHPVAPVISHPTGPSSDPVPMQQVQSTPILATKVSSPPPVTKPSSSNQDPGPSETSPPAEPTSAKKSIFDFVSPFDAFDAPPTKLKKSQSPAPGAMPAPVVSPSIAPAHAQAPGPALVPTASIESAQQLPQSVPAPAPARPNNFPATKPTTIPVPVPMPSSSSTPQSPTPDSDTSRIGTGEPRETKAAFDVTRFKGEGYGPKALSTHTVIDLSLPNLDSLIKTPGTVRVTPVTKMKAESIAYSRGKKLGATSRWLAYALAGGRIRLLDRLTAARTLINLPQTAQGEIVDMATTPNSLAVVSIDGAVTVYSVPVSWERDDPPIKLVLHVLPDPSYENNSESVGHVNRVEWIRGSSDSLALDHLVIGGTNGVVIIRPANWEEQPQVQQHQLFSSNRVLHTAGPVLDFALTSTHQAIGLLSTTGTFSLYSVSTSARVWHRQLPTTTKGKMPLSSVRMCESNILVGRANDTFLELIQITVDVAVLSTFKLEAPSTCPPDLHFAHVEYDSSRCILWVVPYARSSIFALHYALKGVPPIRLSGGGPKQQEPDSVLAFDRFAEFPLEPVVAFVITPPTNMVDSDIFYSSPNGLNDVAIDLTALLEAPPVSKKVVKTGKSGATSEGPLNMNSGHRLSDAPKASASVGTAAAAVAKSVAEKNGSKATIGISEKPLPKGKTENVSVSPAKFKIDLPEVNAVTPSPSTMASTAASTAPGIPSTITAPPASSDQVSSDDLSKALKKTESLLLAQIRNTIQREMSRDDQLANTLSTSVSKKLQSSISTMITQELKGSLYPTLISTLQTEVRTLISNQVSRAINESLSQLLPRELDRTVNGTLTRLVIPQLTESAVNAMHMTLTQSLNHLLEQLVKDFKSEMLQVRKEGVEEVNEQVVEVVGLVKGLVEAVGDLKKVVVGLQGQVEALQAAQATKATQASVVSMPVPVAQIEHGGSNSIVPPGPVPSHVTSLHQPQSQSRFPPPHQPLQQPPHLQPQQTLSTTAPALGSTDTVTTTNLDDTFVRALSTMSVQATTSLVSEFWAKSDIVLPLQPGAKSPLSAAVLLTLLHRLALAISEIPPSDNMFQMCTSWERRVSMLLDPRDPATAGGYFPRVVGFVQATLSKVVATISVNPQYNNHVAVLGQILDVLAQKMAMA